MPTSVAFSRRSVFALLAGMSVLTLSSGRAAQTRVVTVHKNPNCSCCVGWAKHIAKAGFEVKTIDTTDLDAVKKRMGVPADLAACHTAEVDGYAIEGHVPASALQRFLDEKLNATGLAVPGMPIGSPGMEGGRPQTYTVILFGSEGRKAYMRFIGNRAL